MKKSIIMIALLLLVYFSNAQANIILNSDFENGKIGDWKGRGSASLTVTDETANKGKYSLLTKARTQSWNGPVIDLTGKIFFTGAYKFSAWVKIKDGQPDSEMIMSIERSKSGNTNWDRVLALNSKAGTWVNLTGDYEPKGDFEKISVYIESTNATLEYYIDDITITVTKEPQKTGDIAKKEIEKNIPSLSDVYKDNFKIGTCVELDQLQGVEGELLLKHFSSLTPENILKPEYIEPTENNFTFDNVDKLVDFALKNNMPVRGHTLLWHTQNAKWMFFDKNGNKVSKSVLLKRLETYIKTVVTRYKGKIYAWDVVNEVVDGAGLRKSEWLDIIGEEYIEKAFKYARKADPKAKLFINDYETTDKVKGETLYNLVKKLKAKRIPIDGIGMQFHISLEYPSIQAISDSMKKFSDLGLEIHITELDMSINADPMLKAEKASEDLLIRQAYRYKEIFNIFKSYKNITNVTFWGFNDGHTWLTSFPIKKADWPLLFDGNFKAKYAYWGIVDPMKLPKDVMVNQNKNNFIGTAKKGTPVIDGNEDEIWKNAAEMNINIFVQGSGSTGVGKALWDENNLYVFAKVKDNNLSKKSMNAYEQDTVEIFVDEKNNKSPDYMDDDAQYRINFTNDLTTNGNPAKITSVSVVTKDGYNIEVKIPLQSIKGLAGTKIGFDLQINDDSGSGIRDSAAKWNDPTNETYRNTSGFGTLIFE